MRLVFVFHQSYSNSIYYLMPVHTQDFNERQILTKILKRYHTCNKGCIHRVKSSTFTHKTFDVCVCWCLMEINIRNSNIHQVPHLAYVMLILQKCIRFVFDSDYLALPELRKHIRWACVNCRYCVEYE